MSSSQGYLSSRSLMLLSVDFVRDYFCSYVTTGIQVSVLARLANNVYFSRLTLACLAGACVVLSAHLGNA